MSAWKEWLPVVAVVTLGIATVVIIAIAPWGSLLREWLASETYRDAIVVGLLVVLVFRRSPVSRVDVRAALREELRQAEIMKRFEKRDD